jgi:hypothetical protein
MSQRGRRALQEGGQARVAARPPLDPTLQAERLELRRAAAKALKAGDKGLVL